ncbi:Rieske 2Fe-2S domain-containing protein [Phycicoccus sp. MAQZ13P-2]|uniref:cytochrome bc1 complex Rieske iron-sulfur subunit n=1 Tax=Phycicoccus mangrovi TaxID=2840470 RepID=UPI001BFFE84C|nr:Rieske 2Fe-2S domain-containing protein [Phycicoccus mangrovi]MBT9254760.1 Rieske 2Fe-2S domain-containing protein [Phycicoccus mangrovi]MBT9273035.1 Rieske 2Fe-2S domain-containing protein [Phycicoccus mangrovi]
MNEQDPHTPGTEVTPTGSHGEAVRLDEGHVVGTGGLPDRFANPGLPHHVPRMADLDESAAKRAEKQVAALFGLSIVGTLLFIVLYFALDVDQTVFVPGIGATSATNVGLGVALALSLLGIGLGAVHWAKTLMPDEEVVEERHPMRASDADRAEVVRVMTEEGGKSQITRRPLIKMTMGGALGLFAVPLVLQVGGSLGELPKKSLSLTWWNGGPSGPGEEPTFKPLRLMKDPENEPIRAADVTIGSVYHVMPQGLLPDPETGDGGAEHLLEEKAKAAVLVMRLDPAQIQSQKELDWGYEGIVAYSKICTHVGCPVGLYEQQTHHLLCPCHQSTFDVTQDCKVIFGPAKRPLPQLKITVDDEGYLVSAQPFREAIGPSFWERG